MAKIWKVLSVNASQVTSLPIVSKPYVPNNQFFSLFKRTNKRTYTRVSTKAYSSGKIAGRVWANMISSDPLVYSIRPCVIESLRAGKENRFRPERLADTPMSAFTFKR